MVICQKKWAQLIGPIYRPAEDSIMRVVDERGQESITHFKVVESFKIGDLVKLTLETGRTHQIRVHLTHLGHPLYGDSLYGIEGDKEYISRQALHAYRLKFPHPRTGEIYRIRIWFARRYDGINRKNKKELMTIVLYKVINSFYFI